MLAIVIPFYKLEFFKETLQSLSNQTDKRFKVYIGDDASPESPLSLLEAFKNQFQFVYKRFDANLGGTSLVKQWERCVDLAEYEKWIMVLGDDDVLGTNMVETFYNHYPTFNTKSNLIRFSSTVINTDDFGNTKSINYTHPTWEGAYQSYCRKVTGNTRSSLSEHIFLKESFLKKGFTHYPLAFYSDDKAWLDFSDRKPIYSINESCVYIRISDASISGKTDNMSLKLEAEVKFFTYIFSSELHNFTKNCRLHIIRKFEIALLKKNKLSLLQWSQLYLSYLKNYRKKEFLKFNKRLIKSVIFGKKVFY